MATYVTDESMGQLAPLFDSPDKNKCLMTVEQFVRAGR
jgi:hypothetical protein